MTAANSGGGAHHRISGELHLMQRLATVRSVAEDRTLYWTLSFYLPRSRIGQVPDGLQCASSLALSQAIDPLFNDIADRSRQQKVPDRLFCAGPAETLDFTMPRLVEWMTEGSAFAVPIEPERRNRSVSLRRSRYLDEEGAPHPALLSLITDCWDTESFERPDFKEIIDCVRPALRNMRIHFFE